MRRIKELLRLQASGLKYRQMVGATGLSLGVISKYLQAAQAAGLAWPEVAELDEAVLSARLGGLAAPRTPSRFVAPDYAAVHRALTRKGVTLALLWEEYQAPAPTTAYSYTQFCVRYRDWTGCLKRSMRQVHRAGEKLFIDYAGPTVAIVDIATGEIRNAQIFVAVLGASSYTYAEATWTQALPDWIGAHVRTMAFLGGVVEILVPDNVKAGVNRACRYEPELNRSYQEMAAHYGCVVIPARPYKPQDKAKVEVGVQVVERWILARLRHRTFFTLAELNAAIWTLLDALNRRPFKKLPGSRREAFESLDRPALRPLPPQPYEYAQWKQARVHIDYHVEVEGSYYSVPHSLVKKALDVRLTAATVECLHGGKRVASHARSHKRGSYSTLAEHMPRSHRAHAEWSPARLLNWALSIGPATRDVVQHLLETKPHPEMGYRACLGLLSLARQYGKPRLEAACVRAKALGAPTRASVASILKAGLDRQAVVATATAVALPAHTNVRGPSYYH